MDVLVKGVDEQEWKTFRMTALAKNKKVGELFNDLLKSMRKNKGNWETIRKSKASITSEEAEKIKNSIKEFREGFDFREFSI